MNKRFARYTLLAICAYGIPLLHGQQSDVVIQPAETPVAPFVRPAAEGTSWVVEYLRSADQKDPAAEAKIARGGVLKILNVYSNGIRRMTVESPSGRSVVYMTKGLVLYTSANKRSAKVRVTDAVDENSRHNNDKAEAFDDFTWVDARNFAGTASFRGRVCNVYREKTSSEGGSAQTAFIDQATGYPVALKDDNGIVLYRFGPKESFILPPEYAQALKDHEEVSRNIRINTDVSQ